MPQKCPPLLVLILHFCPSVKSFQPSKNKSLVFLKINPFESFLTYRRGPGAVLKVFFRGAWVLQVALTAFLVSCGNAKDVGLVATPRGQSITAPNSPTASGCDLHYTKDCCIADMKTHDTDQDGVNDFDEVYGRPSDPNQTLPYLGANIKIYSNPFLTSSNDIPGWENFRSGLRDNEIQSTKIDGSLDSLASPITRNPALRDFVVRVFGKGGQDSQPNQTSSRVTGWNGFAVLKGIPGDQVFIQDLGVGQFSEQINNHLQNFGILGYVVPKHPPLLSGDSCNAPANLCINHDVRGALIGKFAASPNPSDVGSAPFKIGSSSTMDASHLVARGLTGPPDPSKPYLLLRSNDYGGAGIGSGTDHLGDNAGSITVLVTFVNQNFQFKDRNGNYTLPWPQAAPTGQDELDLQHKLCEGYHPGRTVEF